jgi:hypothetical protein
MPDGGVPAVAGSRDGFPSTQRLPEEVVPDVDNVLTQRPFAAFLSGQFNRVPVINGTNHDIPILHRRVPRGDKLRGSYANLQRLLRPTVGQLLRFAYPLADYQTIPISRTLP